MRPHPALRRPAPSPALLMVALLCGVLAASLSLAQAAVPAKSIEPWMDAPFTTPVEDLRQALAAINAPAGADIQVLFEDTSQIFDPQGRSTERRVLIYRILSQEGISAWAKVGASWAPWYQKVPRVRARILTANGDERWLDPGTLSEAPVAETGTEIFDDRRMLQAPLPALGIGSVVIEETVLEDLQPFFAAGTNHREYLVATYPLYRGRLVIQAPTSLPLRYGKRLADDVVLSQQRLEIEGQDSVRLTFTYGDLPAAGAAEANLPYSQPRFPSVTFSTGESWNAIARAYAQIVDDKLANAELTEILVGFPVDGDRRAQIDFLLAQVQAKVRYTGLELGAASILPVTPAEILDRRFGDCKDQATLLVALLRRVEIPAYVALLRADFDYDVEPELPGFGAFNHAIVYVPGDRPMWIDPTDPFSRAGELPLAVQGRWTLVAAETTRELIPTPTSHSIDNRAVETREIFLPAYGPARVVETTEYHGSLEQEQRALRPGDPEILRQAYEAYVQDEYQAAALEAANETPIGDLSQPFRLRLTATGAERATTGLTQAAVVLSYGNLLGSIPPILLDDSAAERQGDFIFANPFVKEWLYRIHLPPGMEPRQVPEDRSWTLGGMRYEESFQLIPQRRILEARLRLDSGLRRLDPELFAATRQRLKEFWESELTILSFDHQGSVHLAAGRGLAALDVFRRLVQEHPEEVIHRVRLARALNALGMGTEAQRQARLAVEIAPESAFAHWILGRCLARDDLGRHARPGFDLAGAIAATEKATDLDPTSLLFRAELAGLLDLNSQGVRYGAGADVDRAIEEYQRLLESSGGSGLETNLLYSLLYRQRWQDLLELSEKLDADGSHLVWRLIALGALEGAPVVIREAGRLGLDGDAYAQTLHTVVRSLNAMGHFAAGGAVLQHLASRTDNPAAAIRQAQLYANIRPLADWNLTQNDPKTLVRRFFVHVFRPELDIEGFRTLLHPRSVARQSGDDDSLLAIWSNARRQAISDDSIPVPSLIELFLAAFALQVEGDAESGFRVTGTSLLPELDYRSTTYLRPLGDELRIVAFKSETAILAGEALAALDEGDLEGARQWLDWAFEDVPVQGSEDPLSGNVFARQWALGQEARGDDIRLAAWMLLAQNHDTAKEAAAALRPLLEETDDPQLQRRLHQALSISAVLRRSWPEAIHHSQWLFEAEPTSDIALAAHLRYLERSGDEATLETFLEGHLEQHPQSLTASVARARQLLRQGEVDQAMAQFAAIEDADGSPAHRASALNWWTWAKLFQPQVDTSALDLAQRSADLIDYNSYPILHTLAMAYAELDRPFEAYKILLQAISKRRSQDLTDGDLLIMARMAQSYGLDVTARELYERIEPPEEANQVALSSWQLAQRHLSALGQPAKK